MESLGDPGPRPPPQSSDGAPGDVSADLSPRPLPNVPAPEPLPLRPRPLLPLESPEPVPEAERPAPAQHGGLRWRQALKYGAALVVLSLPFVAALLFLKPYRLPPAPEATATRLPTESPSALATPAAQVAGARATARPVAPAGAVSTVVPRRTPAPSTSQRRPSQTATPAAVPTSAATSAPTPASATPTPETGQVAQRLVRQVAQAEETLRTGQFDATLESSDTSRSQASVRFDLGDVNQAARLQMAARYESGSGAQSIERIVVGDKVWQRQAGGGWTVAPKKEGVWDQVRVFLPQAASALEPRLDDGTPPTLRWLDAGRNEEVTVQFDPATGVPHTMQRVSHATGAILSVTYQGWNIPVEISPPNTS